MNGTSLPDTDELIHIQASKIALIATEIVKTLESSELMTRSRIQLLTRRLELWQAEVPLLLQLSVLTSSNLPDITPHQRRAALKVHVRISMISMISFTIIANDHVDHVLWRTYAAVPLSSQPPWQRCG